MIEGLIATAVASGIALSILSKIVKFCENQEFKDTLSTIERNQRYYMGEGI